MIVVPILALIGVIVGVIWSDACLTGIFEVLAPLWDRDEEREVTVIEVYDPHGH